MPKIKVTHVAFDHPIPAPDGKLASHVAVTDTKRRAWERFSNDPPGHWSLIDLPEEPDEPQARPRPVQHRRDSKPRRRSP